MIDLQPLLVVDQMIHDKSMRGNIGFFVDIGTEAFFKDFKKLLILIKR